MWYFIWPILLVVGANSFYNICAKATPQSVDPFASLTITYLVSALLSVVLFFVTGSGKNLFAELSKANWTSYIFGVTIVALEFGYIHLYRAGWKVSSGSLVANISLACVLLLVGLLLYKESISLRQILGMVACVVGLFLISN